MIQLPDCGGNVVAAANNDVRITRPAKQMALVYHCLVLFVHPSMSPALLYHGWSPY
jgi:hypothetical protein